ncbi:TetR family transcriptional regulator [Rouxiella silvae]|uniref:TetR family transcriptional regulator n=1 Tax=Rouxiella silvae TaxID=1646373 RepID=A0ABX3U7J8_9GAMM|nr:TetR/AcrR family transcriptional regulator [Rouxiella silvae]ORJ23242.1 TetR family transcriptional regulator [Rouxiella silvae]
MISHTHDAPKRRLSREARRSQLLETAWRIVRLEGSDALTLARVGEEAGVSKPVVYDHFTTRHGLLAALYEDFDIRQNAIITVAMDAAENSVNAKAAVIAACYVDCVMTQGREIPDVLSALGGSPELAEVKRNYQIDFIEKIQKWFASFVNEKGIFLPSLWAMLGAADSISNAVVSGDITREQGVLELKAIIAGIVARNQ